MEFNQISTLEELQKVYDGSYYTITGAGGDLNDWIPAIVEQLKKVDVGTPTNFIWFNGSLVNKFTHATGNNKFQDDLHFIAFPLDGLDVGKLAMFKLVHGDRWFDDIIDNTRRHEEER
jgi:hypothetical protein